MNELLNFLLARITEDEQTASEAQKRTTMSRRMIGRRMVEVPSGPRSWWQAAGWDPARALAEVEAKRRIMAWASDPKMNPDLIPEAERYYVLTALALPYADHPDYQAKWRP